MVQPLPASGPGPHRLVVVGAGSAGVVVASRLSEARTRTGRPAYEVTLLESGPATEEPAPGRAARSVGSLDFFDALEDPARTHAGVVARRTAAQQPVWYPRGRGVGGSASVNAMVGLWPLRQDHDAWTAAGAPALGWQATARARRRAIVANPLTRRPVSEWSPFEQAVRLAALDAGLPPCDVAAPHGEGIGAAPLTADARARRSVVETYLRDARHRPNLVLRPEAAVERIVWVGRRAAGVSLASGEQIEADAVVLCAGALHSPALLAHSGVTLEGVGANLADHASIGLTVQLRPGAQLAPGAPAVSGLARYSSGLDEAGFADMQLLALGATGASAAGRTYASLQAAVMVPFSRGSVRPGRGAGAVAVPEVDFGLLADERDRARLASAVDILRRIAEHPSVEAVADGVYVDDRGGLLSSLDGSNLDAWLDERVGAYVHATGTCAMGPATDRMAVVDEAGSVHGHEALAVLDASILPVPPRVNTHLPVVLAAETLVERWVDTASR
ncbi:MAG: GMC family oxidoreductase [Acidimicrobiia bacterium]|nr:GMC family oxidoreductase [Acidimicrobiia bacterium]